MGVRRLDISLKMLLAKEQRRSLLAVRLQTATDLAMEKAFMEFAASWVVMLAEMTASWAAMLVEWAGANEASKQRCHKKA